MVGFIPQEIFLLKVGNESKNKNETVFRNGSSAQGSRTLGWIRVGYHVVIRSLRD